MNNDEIIKRKAYRMMNEYFNNLKKCDQEHHHGSDCCYLGTPYERNKKYWEIYYILKYPNKKYIVI